MVSVMIMMAEQLGVYYTVTSSELLQRKPVLELQTGLT